MRQSARVYGGILLAGMALGGCLYYGSRGTALRETSYPRSEAVKDFEYVHEEDRILLDRPIDWGLYQVQKFRLPTSLQTDLRQSEYHLFYYRPKGQGPFPGVVILPITRGDYYTQNFAVYLAERGYACLRFESTKNFTDDSYKTLESAERLLRHYVIDVRRGIDWLSAQKEVDAHRLGIMGISLGAIVASVVMGVDARVQAGVFLLGGANLAGIIDTSEENSLIKFRRRVIEHEGLDAQQFKDAATRVLKPVDPMSYAHRLNPHRVLMINGYFDHVIHREYVKAFWEASSRPELVFIPTGHYSAGFLVAYARAKTFAHFERILR